MKVDGIEIVIESSATKACTELDRMIAKMNQVNSTLRSTSAMGGAKGIGSVTNGLRSYNSMASRATKATTSFASAIGRFYATCFLAIRGIKALGKAISSSMDYIETYNYFNVITDKIGTEFGSAWKENGYTSAEEYAKSFRSRLTDLTGKMSGFSIDDNGGLNMSNSIGLGIDPQQLLNYQASIASITNAVGLTGEVSTGTSKALSMLSADLSSLKNVDLETVMTNLQSGLIGQSRALYKYGIDITNNTLQEYALANGIKKKVSEMTQAEKMQLRMIAILDQSKVAYGDMANTISSVANQYRMMKQQISNLGRVIGNLFIPVLQQVLPFINGFLIALQRLFSWVGKLLGIDWSGIMDGISSGYTDTGLDALGEDTDDVTSGLDDANKSAKKLKNTLQGFDELNNISVQSGGDDEKDNGGSVDLSGAIGSALGDYESIWNKAFEDMENKAEAWANKITGFFNQIWKAIEPFRNAIKELWDNGLSKLANFSWQALKDFYNDFLVPIDEWAFGTEDKGLTRLVDIINNSLGNVDWETLNKSLKDFWTAIEPYAESFGEGMIDFFEDMADIGVEFINSLATVLGITTNVLSGGDPENAEKWGYALAAVATGLYAFEKCMGIVTTIGGIVTAIKGFVAYLPNLSAVVSTLQSINPGMWGEMFIKFEYLTQGTWLDTSTWTGVFGDIRDAINGGIDFVFGGLGDALESIINSVFDWSNTMQMFQSAKENFQKGGLNIVLGIGEGILGALGFLIEPIGNIFTTVWNALCNILGIHSPATTMNPIGKNIILGIVDGIKGNIESIVQSVSLIPQRIKGALSNLWSVGREAISGFYNGFKSLHIPTPHFDWSSTRTITLGRASFSIPSFSVDWYKNGGFPSGELWGMNETGNPEMVGNVGGKTAVANNSQITDAFAQAIYPAIYNAMTSALKQGNSKDGDIVVQIGGREVFRAVREEDKKYKTSTGKSAFAT